MKVVTEYPPNYEIIKKVFDLSNKNPVFAYGDILYNPSGKQVSDHLIAHELVHKKQQGELVEEWWEKYLQDNEFRLSQELEAYRVQYKYICKHIKDRNRRVKYARHLAEDLSSEMYGNIIRFDEALHLITI